MTCSFASVTDAPEKGASLKIEIGVALVEHQVDAAAVCEPHDALEIGAGDDGARWIGGRVEDDGLGARRDGALDRFGGDAEILALGGLDVNELAAGVLDDVLVGDPVGHGQDDLVAMVDEHLDGIEERELAAGGEDRFFRGVAGAEVAGVALHDGLANLGDAGDDGVAREVGFNGGDGRVLDVARRGEMRLAGAEIDQLRALGAQLGGGGGDGHGGGDFDAADAFGQLRRGGRRGAGLLGVGQGGGGAHAF